MVINNYLPFVGGSEIQAHKLSKQLVSNGHTVDVLTSKSMNKDLKSLELLNNVKIIRVPSPYIKIAKYGVGQSFFTFCNFLYFLIKYLSRYDLIHVHQALRPALATAIVAKLYKKPSICKIGNGGARFDLSRYQNTYFEGVVGRKLITKYISFFISISTEIYELLLKEVGKDRIISIPNGVEIINSNIKNRPKDRSIIHLISIGSLTKKKDYNFLIDSISCMDKVLLDRIKILILGDGPEKSSLRKKICHLKLEKIFCFKGNVDDVNPYLSDSDLFILTSKAEGMSNALLEALASGLPAICSDVGNNSELILGKVPKNMQFNYSSNIQSCGFIYGKGNNEEFIKALEHFINLDIVERKELALNAFETSKSYDIESISQIYGQMYHSIVSSLYKNIDN